MIYHDGSYALEKPSPNRSVILLSIAIMQALKSLHRGSSLPVTCEGIGPEHAMRLC